ncbi:MAG: type II toxin-antitoxin system VapC family toxin [Kiritimatiellaeota bacterium]|nr:type II toxin-antitoxin system VapC family toxin [Kiritimatiellota bacterium]
MILMDVNVLVYAHRKDTQRHGEYHRWLQGVLTGDAGFGVTDVVLSGFVRIVTHPRIFDPPTPLPQALAFAEVLRTHPAATLVQPGPRHWELFSKLCREAGAAGNLIADAWLAALAIESGCEWITTDRDFARFPGLRWRAPL